MAAKPYYTTNDLIEAVKRKISFPTYQSTFTTDDIIAFLNEEMFISQVPSMLQFHEEFFVFLQRIPLQSNITRYPIPSRAIGMRLRDVMWADQNGNLFEMTRIHPEDKAYFQRNIGANEAIHKFYIESNDIILSPTVVNRPTGSLYIYYFLRPNQLVEDDRAAFIESFQTTITVDNTTLTAGDTVAIGGTTFTAAASGASDYEFNIGGTSLLSATNLVNAINNADIGVTATNESGLSAIVTLVFTDITKAIQISQPSNYYLIISANIISSNSSALAIPSTIMVNCDEVPDFFESGNEIDFLETEGGHKIKGIDVEVVTVSGNQLEFNITDIPYQLVVGDYICLANESIIPNIPSDLHNGLAERACSRILAAIGDQSGLAVTQAKIQEIEQRTGTLIDSRVDGQPLKVVNRFSPLRLGRLTSRRRV